MTDIKHEEEESAENKLLKIAMMIDGKNVRIHQSETEQIVIDYEKLLFFLRKKYGEENPIFEVLRLYTPRAKVVSSGQKRFWKSLENIGFGIIFQKRVIHWNSLNNFNNFSSNSSKLPIKRVLSEL